MVATSNGKQDGDLLSFLHPREERPDALRDVYAPRAPADTYDVGTGEATLPVLYDRLGFPSIDTGMEESAAPPPPPEPAPHTYDHPPEPMYTPPAWTPMRIGFVAATGGLGLALVAAVGLAISSGKISSPIPLPPGLVRATPVRTPTAIRLSPRGAARANQVPFLAPTAAAGGPTRPAGAAGAGGGPTPTAVGTPGPAGARASSPPLPGGPGSPDFQGAAAGAGQAPAPPGAQSGSAPIQLPAVQAGAAANANAGAAGAAGAAPAAAAPAGASPPPPGAAAAGGAPTTGYFTLGATMDDVAAVQGKPDKSSDNQWSYGTAYVTFTNGKVTGWSNVGDKLKVRLEPAQKADVDAVTLGSTMDQVASLMGTPDYLSPVQWTYGGAYLTFRDGVVNGWSNSGGKLKLKLGPGGQPGGTFGVGSTSDEVAAAQGVPDYLAMDRWQYGPSTVDFVNGRVVGWTNVGGTLHVRLNADGTPTPKSGSTDAPASVYASVDPGTASGSSAAGLSAQSGSSTVQLGTASRASAVDLSAPARGAGTDSISSYFTRLLWPTDGGRRLVSFVGPRAASGYQTRAFGPGRSLPGAIPVASTQLGRPYVWGGASPATSFDCSGLVQWAFGQLGVAMPRTAQEQYYASVPVADGALQPGDLVFFSGTYPSSDWITHVGIYLGDGRMISATTEGGTVSETPVFTGYLGDHYAGGGRIRA